MKTLMHGSNLGLQTWAIAVYLLTTSFKGVSSMKLHHGLGITQKAVRRRVAVELEGRRLPYAGLSA